MDWREQVVNMAQQAVAGFTPGPATPQPLSFAAPHVSPSFDLAELLPEPSAELLRRLRQRSQDAHAVMVPFSEIQERSAARVLAEQRLRTLKGPAQEFGNNLPDDHGSVIEAKRTLARTTAEFQRINERAERKAAAWRSVSGSLANCENFLRDGRPANTLIEACETEPPKLGKNENLLDVVEKLRRRGRELHADASRISSAQFPADYVKAKMRQRISALAEIGAPDVSSMLEHDGPLTFATQRTQAQVLSGPENNLSLAFSEIPDSTATLCWLMRDEIIRRLDKEIDAEVDPNTTPLSYEDRERKSAEIALDLLDVERQEAAAVWQAMEQGLPCEHRSDASVLAVLQIRLVTVTATNGHGPSTSTLAYDIVRGGGR